MSPEGATSWKVSLPVARSLKSDSCTALKPNVTAIPSVLAKVMPVLEVLDGLTLTFAPTTPWIAGTSRATPLLLASVAVMVMELERRTS